MKKPNPQPPPHHPPTHPPPLTLHLLLLNLISLPSTFIPPKVPTLSHLLVASFLLRNTSGGM